MKFISQSFVCIALAQCISQVSQALSGSNSQSSRKSQESLPNLQSDKVLQRTQDISGVTGEIPVASGLLGSGLPNTQAVTGLAGQLPSGLPNTQAVTGLAGQLPGVSGLLGSGLPNTQAVTGLAGQLQSGLPNTQAVTGLAGQLPGASNLLFCLPNGQNLSEFTNQFPLSSDPKLQQASALTEKANSTAEKATKDLKPEQLVYALPYNQVTSSLLN